VGSTQKYLSSEAVENIVYTKKTLSFDLIEGGEFAVYLAEGKPVADEIKFVPLGNGLWKGVAAKVISGQRVKVVIRKVM